MSQPIVIPYIVSARWREACASPSIPRWYSLAKMCSMLAENRSIYACGSPVIGDLRTLAGVAYAHSLLMQPHEDDE